MRSTLCNSRAESVANYQITIEPAKGSCFLPKTLICGVFPCLDFICRSCAHLYGPIDQRQWAITLRPTQCGCSSALWLLFSLPEQSSGAQGLHIYTSIWWKPLCLYLFAASLLFVRCCLGSFFAFLFSFFHRRAVNTQRPLKLAGKMRKMMPPIAGKWKTHSVLSFAAHLARTWKLLSTYRKAEELKSPKISFDARKEVLAASLEGGKWVRKSAGLQVCDQQIYRCTNQSH